MKRISVIAAGIILLASFTGCSGEDIDEQMPEIIMTGEGYFPQNCDTLYPGESFTFRARFTDNVGLGSYSIDIHHNFDHHSHSTEPADCPTEENKTPVNPFLFIGQFDIPPGQREYEALQEIEVPADIDQGDYHMMVRVTDETGWQAIRGISIKLIAR